MVIKVQLLPESKLKDEDHSSYKNRPTCIVMHNVGVAGQTAKEVLKFFETSPTDAHYVIDLDGTTYQCIPDNVPAMHAHHGGKTDPVSGKFFTDEARARFGTKPNGDAYSPNTKSIGIEMCQMDAEGAFTPETYNSAVALVSLLCKKYGLKEKDITTHHNLVGWKPCPALWTKFPVLLEQFRADVFEALA